MFLMERFTRSLDRLRWLNPTARALRKGIRSAYSALGPSGETVENVLHGTGLGHPLHTMLNDGTIGSWTTAVELDVLQMITGRQELGAGADAALSVGLASVLTTALSGLTDWQYLGANAQRLGLVHALLNTTGALIFGTSLFLRSRGLRSAGWGTALLGFAGLTVSAYIGAHLVYEEKIGVNRSNEETLPAKYVDVLGENELTEGQPHRADADGSPIVLVRQNGQIYAMAEKCAHMGGPLANGHLHDDSIVCPWHMSRFRLQDGRVLNGPSAYDQPCLAVRVQNGRIEVRLPSTEPEIELEKLAGVKQGMPAVDQQERQERQQQQQQPYYMNRRPEEKMA